MKCKANKSVIIVQEFKNVCTQYMYFSGAFVLVLILIKDVAFLLLSFSHS